MRLLQLLHVPKNIVAEKMWYRKELYYKKFYSTTSMHYEERFNKVKPYILKHIEELQDEIQFLDIYFSNHDRLPALFWGNKVSKLWWKRTRWDKSIAGRIWWDDEQAMENDTSWWDWRKTPKTQNYEWTLTEVIQRL